MHCIPPGLYLTICQRAAADRNPIFFSCLTETLGHRIIRPTLPEIKGVWVLQIGLDVPIVKFKSVRITAKTIPGGDIKSSEIRT
jgi:hypothetical protein